MDIQELRRERLRGWLRDHGGHAMVARDRKLTLSMASYLSQIVGGYSIAEKAARSWEERLGMPHGYLDQFVVEEHPFTQYGQAQPMSLTPFDDPQAVTWDAIVQRQPLPRTFVCPMPDDALSPGTPCGTLLLFEVSDSPPASGVGVLVEDMHGMRHIRVYRAGIGGRWLAWARNEHYPTLNDVEHGLKIIAVARNRMLDGTL
jgi:hypothetical protein